MKAIAKKEIGFFEKKAALEKDIETAKRVIKEMEGKIKKEDYSKMKKELLATIKTYELIIKDLEAVEIIKSLPLKTYESGGGDYWYPYVDMEESVRLTYEQFEKLREFLK